MKLKSARALGFIYIYESRYYQPHLVTTGVAARRHSHPAPSALPSPRIPRRVLVNRLDVIRTCAKEQGPYLGFTITVS